MCGEMPVSENTLVKACATG